MSAANARSTIRSWRGLQLIGIAAAVVGATIYWQMDRKPGHTHPAGSHGGIIVAVGHDHHHVEALFAEGGVFKLFTLGQDETKVATVPTQTITAYVRTPQTTQSMTVVLEPKPQPGDPAGQTSAFEGQLPLELVGSSLQVVVPNIAMAGGRYRFSFMTQDSHEAAMPRKVTSEVERELYLTPGGKYTQADITANGSKTASQKFRSFQSSHDMHPASGDTVCPITRTKANQKCTWIVDGKEYQFCCPPCIDEFVKLAKEQPEQLRAPSEYKQE